MAIAAEAGSVIKAGLVVSGHGHGAEHVSTLKVGRGRIRERPPLKKQKVQYPIVCAPEKVSDHLNGNSPELPCVMARG